MLNNHCFTVSTNQFALLCIFILVNYKVKRIHFSLPFIIFYCIYRYTSIKIKLELKKNIFKFGYRINFKYEGMLANSFDRFYVVTIFILPCIKDIIFSKLNYENTCTYIDVKNSHNAETKKYILNLLAFCKKIEPYVDYYRKQIKSYNSTTHYILKNKIDLVLLPLPTKQKHDIIITLVLGFIGYLMKEFPVFCIVEDTKPYIKQLKPWTIRQQFSITNSCTWKIQWYCVVFTMQRHQNNS